MADFMNVNPLMDFARKTECSVKLPSQGLWYDDDNISFNAIGEVDIMPMLPNDEMKLVNPETLISGDAIISLIKSCCPGIKRPEELYYPDVNVLLLGIRKATYGDELTQSSVCPKCWAKKSEIEDAELIKLMDGKDKEKEDIEDEELQKLIDAAKDNAAPKLTQMEKNNEILLIPQEAKYSCSELLSKITLMPKECVYKTPEGLKIYLTPYKCIDKIKFTNRNIQSSKITKFYKEEMNNFEYEKTSPEYMELIKKLLGMYENAANQTAEIIALCVKKVVLPDETIVDNKEYIKEFVLNLPANQIQDMVELINNINDYGLPATLDYECQCCHEKWKDKFYGFNQSDFFGTGSSG